MQNNLDPKVIGNRQISIDLLYWPTMSVIDKRGQIIDSLKKEYIFDVSSWGIGNDRIILRDGDNDAHSKNIVSIGYNHCRIMSSSINSVVWFGEMTLTPAECLFHTWPQQALDEMGKMYREHIL